MTLGAPLGLLGLLAIPAVIAIHLYRRRYTPVAVSGLFLFGMAAQSAAAGRTRQPLVQSRSLWCELLAVLALTWFLTDPHLDDRETSDHLIVVLDDRASLQALGAEAPHDTVHTRLVAALEARLSDLDRDDRVTLILSGSPPRLLAGPATSPGDAKAKLSAWRAEGRWEPLDAALALAEQLGRGADGLTNGARTLVVTDRPPPALAEGIGLLAIGEARPTLGIIDARWLLADARFGERLFVRVAAFGDKTRQGVLSVTADGVPIGTAQVVVAPGEAAPYFIPVTPPADAATDTRVGKTLTITLRDPSGARDPWPRDDTVTVIRPATRRVRVFVSEGAATPPVIGAVGAVEGVTLVSDPGVADLVIVTGAEAAAATPRAGAWTLALHGASADGSGVARDVVAVGPFLAAHGHPLLAGLDWAGVVWVGARPPPTEAAAGGTYDAKEPLLMAGSNVLISEARRGRDRDLSLWLEAGRSTLIDHPSWPGLFANVIEARRQALPGTALANVLLGQPVHVTAPEGAADVMVVPMDGRDGETADTAEGLTLVVDADGALMLPSLERPGRHQFLVQRAGASVPTVFATVNGMPLDGRLADLRTAASATRPAALGAGSTVERRRGALAHTLPLTLAALLLLLGWHFFRRPRRPMVTA